MLHEVIENVFFSVQNDSTRAFQNIETLREPKQQHVDYDLGITATANATLLARLQNLQRDSFATIASLRTQVLG